MVIKEQFFGRFFRLALINILSNLLVPLASLCDLAFLGHLSEISHLGGVALANVIFQYLYWTFGFLRMGTTGMTAQAVGRSDCEAAQLCCDLPGTILILLRHTLIALTIGIVILLLQYPLREIGFTILNADESVKLAGRDYFKMMVWGAPATLINFVFIGWFLGREQGKNVFFLSAVNNTLNVFLNYLLIVRYGWASTGAGLATAASQYAMLLVGLILVFRELNLRTIQELSPKIWDKSALKAVFALNSNILIRTFALVSTFSAFTNISAAMGTIVLASNTLLLQVITLSAHFIDGFAFATESLAGNFRGQGKEQKLIPLVKVSGGISLAVGLLFATVFNIYPQALLGLLTNHGEVLARVNNYVIWLFPVLGFGSIAYMLDGYFLGLTEAAILRKSSLVAALLGFTPLCIIAWHWQNIHLLWLALTLFMVGRVVTLGTKVKNTFASNN